MIDGLGAVLDVVPAVEPSPRRHRGEGEHESDGDDGCSWLHGVYLNNED
jgi:hypothetical protein